MSKINYIQRQNIVYLLVIITSYIFLFQNRLWPGFVFADEGDNFTGGWLISKGYVLYKDMFSQHMPFPYYYASLLIKLGLNDVNGLRIGWSLTILFFWILIIVIFKEKVNYKLLCILIFLSAITHPIFWGHMFLADSFFAYSILIIFLYFFSNPQLNFNIKDKIVIALMVYISIMSALVSIFPIMVLGLYYVVKKVINFSVETNIQNRLLGEIKFALIIVTPFILSLIFFYSTGSLREFFNQAYLFNKIYYSQFYVQFFTGTPTILQFFEPIKAYSEHIFFYIFNFDWLINKESFLWVVPPWNNKLLFFEGFLVISNLGALVVFWKKRNLYFSIFYFSFLAFLRIRVVWFHLIPYYLLSFFSIGFVITEAYEFFSYKLRNRQLTTKIKLGFIPIIFYGFLAIIFLGVISYAYVSNGSGIGANDAYFSRYDRIVQTLTQPEDAIWVAPFEPSLYFTNRRLPASRHTYYLPWNALSDKINEELIEDLGVKKPPLIIFQRDAEIWGYAIKDYGKVVDNYIQQNYYQVDPDDPTYKNIYLINTKRNQLFETLNDSGLYQPSDAKQMEASDNIGEIVAGFEVVQTFTPKHRINRIDILLATFARSNHGQIVFHLKDDLKGKDIFSKTEEISNIKDNGWYRIDFQRLNESLIDKTIYLVIEAPESKLGDAITIYTSKNDSYNLGELYINGQPTGKDITFRTYWSPYSNNATY